MAVVAEESSADSEIAEGNPTEQAPLVDIAEPKAEEEVKDTVEKEVTDALAAESTEDPSPEPTPSPPEAKSDETPANSEEPPAPAEPTPPNPEVEAKSDSPEPEISKLDLNGEAAASEVEDGPPEVSPVNIPPPLATGGLLSRVLQWPKVKMMWQVRVRMLFAFPHLISFVLMVLLGLGLIC